MSEATPAVAPKPKKSVALSGVPAGNTALCTVGRQGNDLHYRGYDILEVAETCEFEELAYLLIHGKLPNAAELASYKAKLRSLRGLPTPLRAALESLPADRPAAVVYTRAGVAVAEGSPGQLDTQLVETRTTISHGEPPRAAYSTVVS